MKKLWAATTAALLLSTVAHADTCEINLEKYKQLQIGMTYSDVIDVLGREGTVSSESEGAGFKIEMYNWKGLSVMLTNGKASMKSHNGLK